MGDSSRSPLGAPVTLPPRSLGALCAHLFVASLSDDLDIENWIKAKYNGYEAAASRY
jgi:hypothetical protein